MRNLLLALFLGVIITSVGCDKSDFYEEDEPEYVSSATDAEDIVNPNYPIGVENALWKARQLSEIRWSPITDLPSTKLTGGSVNRYRSGSYYYGLPYSSVKEMFAYVGLNVSVHTFITAIHDPRSILYTDDVSKSPYHGYNCGAYYGDVCSTSVGFALGLDLPYSSLALMKHPLFMKVKQQSLEGMKICDILVRDGHVVMIYDIERDTLTGEVKSVAIFENTSIKSWTLDEFMKFWKEGSYVLMRYCNLSSNLDRGFDNEESSAMASKEWDMELCTNMGDKATYATGQVVKIDVLKGGYSTLELFNESGKVKDVKISGDRVELGGLPYGQYKARLSDGEKYSDYTFFEILDVNVQFVRGKKELIINFSSCNAEPVGIDIANLGVSNRYGLHTITQEEKILGNAVFNSSKIQRGMYCKVMFKGKYGTAINTPICLD